ncbi:16S rRNA (guanine(527)-N(7))-methyltransferase RsmG [Subtercola sp. YIM 133946]|uniref:16S rRNA (guanine(527)-N(7))-methyltransferase RsmG n=1 Tax=Subtercola sp. YIM 133946 TaxID=3118909 RepID=UPI002F94FFE9
MIDYDEVLRQLEPEPAVADELFGDRIEFARRFTTNLARHGEEYGLIGPLELPRLWTRHVLNSAVLAPLFSEGRVGDVGSGAGLPGLVLAIARPDVEFVLIEPMERRVKWLNDQVDELELANASVVRGRAQDVGFKPGLDQVTARAVSALSKLIPMCAPLLRPGGQLVLMKGASVDREVEAAEKVIRRFGVSNLEVLELGAGILPESTRVVRATVA